MLTTDLLLEKVICFNKYLCLSGLKKKSSLFSLKKKSHKVYNILFVLVFCFTFKVNLHYSPLYQRSKNKLLKVTLKETKIPQKKKKS